MNYKRFIYTYDTESNYKLLFRFTNIPNNNFDDKKIIYNIVPYNYIEHNNNSNLSISIHKEILRSIIIKKLIKIFTDTIRTFRIKNLGLIFKYNKLEDYVHKWCWRQYENENIKDVVIPYIENETYDFDEFIKEFNYTMKKANITKESIESLIKNVKHLLKKSYLDFINTKNENINITKKRDNDIVTFKCNYRDEEYKISINNNLYIRLLKKCNVMPSSEIDNYIFCLIFRYSYIDAENQQLAIHKKIKEMFKEYGVNFELYGSGINVLSDHYCSLFYDIEKYFGSKGNFFDIELKSGIYWCNPPYIDGLMTKTAYKLINIMNKTDNIAFIITIPIWDLETQSLKFTDITRNPKEHREKFDDYPIYALLKPYIKDELIIPKNRIPYFNYRHYKPINARDTYMLIVYKNIQFKDFHIVFDKIMELDKTDFFILHS